MCPTLPLGRARGRIARALDRATRLEVATDFDGTLVGIVARPDAVVPPARTRRLIARLAAMSDVRVAVLSGRPLADLERRLPMAGVFLAGSAGLELRETSGRRRRTTARSIPRRLIEALRDWCRRFEGAWVEDKGPAIAVHFRAVRPRRRGAFGTGVRRRVVAHRGGVLLERGKMVYELRPAGTGTKASALDRWRGTRPGARTRGPVALFYFGDDANDEPVFRRVRHLGGFTVAVGRRRSGAEFRVRGPDAVVAFLDRLASAWQARLDRSAAHGVQPTVPRSGAVARRGVSPARRRASAARGARGRAGDPAPASAPPAARRQASGR